MKDTVRLCIIKVIIGFVIAIATIIGATQLKSPDQSQNPIITGIGFIAIVALVKWKPANNSSSSGMTVKPLNKQNDKSDV